MTNETPVRSTTSTHDLNREPQYSALQEHTALKVSHLVKQYPQVASPVLNDISLDVPRGKVTVILGPSGSGKSTFLRTIAGLEDIQSGRIMMGDEDIAHVSDGKTRRASSIAKQAVSRIGMVFQSYDLFPHHSVLDNITLAPLVVAKRAKSEVLTQAHELLERVGLADKADAMPSQLSGGQRQRVAIARSLIMNPEVMLFDEVTAALDPEMVREVLDVIVELADRGMTMMIVTHEIEFARAVADQVILLDGGVIVEQSSDPEKFFIHPQIERAQQFLRTFEFERQRDSIGV